MIRLNCYDLSHSNDDGIHGWYDRLPGDVQAAIDGALEAFGWEDSLEDLPQYKTDLRGACEGLDEVIIDMEDGRRFRILAFRSARKEVTLLYGFEKTNTGTATYGAPCRSAVQRKEGVLKNGQKAKPCSFP